MFSFLQQAALIAHLQEQHYNQYIALSLQQQQQQGTPGNQAQQVRDIKFNKKQDLDSILNHCILNIVEMTEIKMYFK